MLITRKTKVPYSWAFFAQLIIVLSIYGAFVINAPFLLLIKKFIDNPAAIMGLISIEVYITLLGGPFVAWLSDRIWTRYGRRMPFVAAADFLKVIILLLMPLAPNLWVLIALRWAFGVVGDLGAPAQALIWEIVPAKQRGVSAGFMKAYMNLGNLVFFTLLLGRFDDVYFLGPFSYLTEVSGGAVMFWLAALIFLGAAIFEAFGIKETYPVGRTRLNDGRRPGEAAFLHFLRSVFRDIFAKDLLPLYLLLFANVMFGFSLGVFQPLLFTEQWGYDLQMFGNTIAIGVPLGIVLGLLGGWIADRYGKMLIVFWATVGNLSVNILYTWYVYTLPDYRPSFWEIVGFGNLAFVFGAIKGVASGPLLWEYVARNRMGAATGGIMVFNTIFRNTVALFVGVWLMWWSIWFFPQAGYNLTATFRSELARDEVEAKLREAGVDLSEFKLRPIHQYGVDGATSRRWWIHREDIRVQELFKEKENLDNRINALNRKRSSILTGEEKKEALSLQIQESRQRIRDIDQELEHLARQLEASIVDVLDGERFRPGDQLLAASFEDGQLQLRVQTIELLPEARIATLRRNLQGPEFLLRPEADESGRIRLVPDLEIQPEAAPVGELPAVALVAQTDARFMDLFRAAYSVGLGEAQAFSMSTAIMATGSGLFGRDPQAFAVSAVTAGRNADGLPEIAFTLSARGRMGLGLTVADIREALSMSDPMLGKLKADEAPSGAARCRVEVTPQDGDKSEGGFAEVSRRLGEAMDFSPAEAAFTMAVFRKLVETLAARPIYVTVPRHEIETGAAKREYEYFFSSQILQIVTDFFGIGILVLLIYLEKRGHLHRAGAEEDLKR